MPGSAARQLFISSTLLDSSTATRQTSTDLDRSRRPGAWSQARQARQELDSNSTGSTGKASTAPRQRLDSASTEPRQLDSSTARAQLRTVGSRVAATRGERLTFPDRSHYSGVIPMVFQHSGYIPNPFLKRHATFPSHPSNDKIQAGRHHPKMGVFERVNRFLFDRRWRCSSRREHRAPRSR